MILIEGVSKSFDKLDVLTNIDLGIERGERVAFVGSNGSGKTTLLRAILGLIRVRGRIRVDGIDVALEPQRALTRMAYIPQLAPPLEVPVVQVVSAFARLRGIRLEAVAARAERLGLEFSKIGATRFRDLSGGMKQKLLAALALSVEAQVMLCDEPTANLDAPARQSFFEQLEEGPSDRAVVVCSHRIEEISELVDRVVEFEDGHVRRDLLCREPEHEAPLERGAPLRLVR